MTCAIEFNGFGELRPIARRTAILPSRVSRSPQTTIAVTIGANLGADPAKMRQALDEMFSIHTIRGIQPAMRFEEFVQVTYSV